MERWFLSEKPELFAVIRYDAPFHLELVPALPLEDHLILFEATAGQNQGEAMALPVGDGQIIAIQKTCIGRPPAEMLPGGAFSFAPPGSGYEVILRGPAYK